MRLSCCGPKLVTDRWLSNRVGSAPAQLGAKYAGKSSQNLPKDAKLPIFKHKSKRIKLQAHAQDF